MVEKELLQILEPSDGDPDSTTYRFRSSGGWKEIFSTLEHQPTGLSAASLMAGIKYPDVYDFTVVKLSRPGPAAGIFTTNRCSSAAVRVDREHLQDGVAQGLVVISKNANVFTPTERQDTEAVVSAVARAIDVRPADLLISCTGVIGVPLPVEKVMNACRGVSAALKPGLPIEVAKAILTTDRGPKVCSTRVGDLVLCGMAKGAGMIEPNMATMLVYFFTNLNLPAAELQAMLSWSAERTFNSMSVDTDTSTSDSLVIFSTGDLAATPERIADLKSALYAASMKLARDIAYQAEGSTKLVQANVKGAASVFQAKQIAKFIVNSPLVKTALFGADPNWGRVVMAIGKPGQEKCDPIDSHRVSISIAGSTLFNRGSRVALNLSAVSEEIKRRKKIDIEVELGEGGAEWCAYGCDLSYEYVKTNAEYTT